MSQALAVPGAHGPLEPWSSPQFTVVRPLFSFLGRTYRVYAADGTLVIFARLPLFRLRQEIILYEDEAEQRPLLVIQSRRILAFNLEHDLFDAATGDRMGSVRTRGLASLLRDGWDILDAEDRLAGSMDETGAALLRRVVRFLPGHHSISLGGREVARLDQVFHLFRREFELTLLPVPDPIEPRLAIACALLAAMADLRRERDR